MLFLIFGSLFLAVLFSVLECYYDGKFIGACGFCILLFFASLIISFVIRYQQGRLDMFLIEYNSIVEMVEQGHNNEAVLRKVLDINQTIYNAKFLKEKWMFNKLIFDDLAELEPINIQLIKTDYNKNDIENGN